jgi:tetratricopeptide (TPR) repeat protein
MKKTISILILFLHGTISLLHAQTDVIMRQVQSYISNFNYRTVIELLEPETKKKNVRAETFELLGDCYRALEDRKKAAYYYEKRIARGDNNIPPDIFLHYGELLIHEGNYAAAKAHLRTYYNNAPNPNPLVQTFMTSCDTAMAWMARKNSSKIFTVENLRRLNSKSHDWGAMYHNNGIMFISNRPHNNLDDSPQYYTVYKSNYKRVNNLGSPEIFFTNMKTNIHLGPVAFTKDSRTIYFTQTNADISRRDKTGNGTIWKNELELKIAKITNNKLSSIKSFKYNNPREYSIGHACLSPNDSVLYYVSDMPGGYGGTDIYYSVLDEEGEWTAPMNAGPMINTAGNEMFPTMDGTVLYFSSNGRTGLGGLDIFRAKGEKNNWTITENMYYPINSSGDDFYFILSPDNRSAFFASNRPGGLGGDDIYTLTLTRPLPDFGYMKNPSAYERKIRLAAEKAKLERMVTFTGTVTNEVTHGGIDSVMISFVNDITKEQIICTTDNAGTFSITLDKKESYTYSCVRENYVPSIGQPLAGNDTLTQTKGIHIKMTPIKTEAENVIADNVILDTEQGKGIEYRVQVLANKKYPNWDYLNKIKESYPQLKILYGSFPDVFTRFTVGQFKTAKEATKLKNELRALGYRDAFVVMFVNGKRKVVSYN